MAVLRTLLLGLVGVAAGIAVTLWWLDQGDEGQPPRLPQAIQLPDASPGSPQASPVVRVVVQVAGGRRPHTKDISGWIVGDTNLVLTAAGDIAGASRIDIYTSTGDNARVINVAASDDVHELALLQLAVTLPDIDALIPDSAGGSLHAGLDVIALASDQSQHGEITGTAFQTELGAYLFPLRLDAAQPGANVILLNPETGALVGISGSAPPVQQNDDPSLQHGNYAFDIAPINALLSAVGRSAPMTLPDFTQHYYTRTIPGRLQLLRDLVEARQDQNAIAHGKTILHLDSYTRRYATPLLSAAYTRYARKLVDQQRYPTALKVLEDAQTIIDPNYELSVMHANVLVRLDRHEDAINTLLGSGSDVTEHIREIVIGQALRSDQIDPALVRRVLASDSHYAPYHRLLGEHYSRNGEIGQAIASLERAGQLDLAMATELAPVLDRLRSRRQAPPVTEIPIQRHAGTFVVKARINNSTRLYDLILDTGASYTAISTRVALELGLDNVFIGAPVVELETANGSIFATTAILSSVDISGARVNRVDAVILENSGSWDGLLGQSFLRHFDIDIDRSRSVITFHRRNN